VIILRTQPLSKWHIRCYIAGITKQITQFPPPKNSSAPPAATEHAFCLFCKQDHKKYC